MSSLGVLLTRVVAATFSGSGVKSSPGLMKRSFSNRYCLSWSWRYGRRAPSAPRECLFDDLAVLEDHDLIGAPDRRQPVRDHERRAAARSAL
jgi:hypothetical protein